MGTTEAWIGTALSSARTFPVGSSVSGLGQRAQILGALAEKSVSVKKRLCCHEEA